MITALHMREFALFEKADVEFNTGMTVFTGETGAGKSILVDALGAVFGARASTDWVRHGAEKAEIIAEIESTDPRLLQLLSEQDIESEDGIHIRRVISSEGRSRAWINGTPTAASILKRIGHICLDLHGQHEHQTLLQEEFQRQIIDSRVSSKLRVKTAQAYKDLHHINQQIKHAKSHHADSQEHEAWMRDESERLSSLFIEDNLEDKLEQETASARNIEQIQQSSSLALALLDDQDNNIRAQLAQASHQLSSVAEHHPSLQEALALFGQMEDLASEISPYLQEALDNQIDGEALAETEDRLANLRAAKRRHQCDEQGLIDLLASWEEKLSNLDTASWDEEALQNKLQSCLKAYQQAAQSLHQAREKASASLITALRPFLDQLGLKNMRLQVSIDQQVETTAWKSHGWDHIVFLAAANPGEPFKNLSDTASGGELSRLVLALKGCGALEHAPDTAIFDEIDVGIGGETGWCVGELLRNMGLERQVLVISHLPQVAACAHHQIAIEKFTHDGRTKTQLTMLEDVARKEEMARMLGGVNDESLHHAEQMLNKGKANPAL